MKQDMKNIPIYFFLGLMIFFVTVILLPNARIDWGSIAVKPDRTITVQGVAKEQVVNNQAQFSAGVNAVNDNREKAIEEVNKKITDIVNAVKALGIPESDIKTQNLNINQSEEVYYDGGIQKSRLGQWRVSNTIDILVKDMAIVEKLPDTLTKSGSNNVWGPNFSVADNKEKELELLNKAIDNAREKAESLAKSTGKKLGEIISISEGYVSPVFPLSHGMGAGGGDIYQGMGTIQKEVTVVFGLR